MQVFRGLFRKKNRIFFSIYTISIDYQLYEILYFQNKKIYLYNIRKNTIHICILTIHLNNALELNANIIFLNILHYYI